MRIVDVYISGLSPTSYFQVNKTLLPLLREFSNQDMVTSNIFKSTWKKNLVLLNGSRTVNGLDDLNYLPDEHFFKKCFDELLGDPGDDFSLPNLPMRLNEVIIYILLPSLNHTQQIMHQLISGNINVRDALSFTESCDLKQELCRLISFFNYDVDPNQTEKCLVKLHCAKVMKSCREQSKNILNTADVLELEGDFESVKIIRQKVFFF